MRQALCALAIGLFVPILIGRFDCVRHLIQWTAAPRHFVEPSGVGADLRFEIQHVVAARRSPYQHIEVLETHFFGKVLVIDGDLMLTERDEFSYHEMLAHVPLAHVANNAAARGRGRDLRALVIGGGDGGVAGQLVRNPDVAAVTVVEIDAAVVDVCRAHFPHLAAAFDSPRVRLIHRDGAEWAAAEAEQRAGQFDVVVVDSTDFGASDSLRSAAFHRSLRRLLRAGGVLVSNLSSLSWQLPLVARSVRAQRDIFRHVHVFQLFQPTYTSGHYCFMICADGDTKPVPSTVDWDRVGQWLRAMASPSVDDNAGAGAGAGQPMRYYSRAVHEAAFALPEFARRALDDVHAPEHS